MAGDPVSAFGGVVAVTGSVDAAVAEKLTSIFLEVVAAPDVAPEAREILARKPNLRVLLDPGLGAPPLPGMELRSAGGATSSTISRSLAMVTASPARGTRPAGHEAGSDQRDCLSAPAGAA